MGDGSILARLPLRGNGAGVAAGARVGIGSDVERSMHSLDRNGIAGAGAVGVKVGGGEVGGSGSGPVKSSLGGVTTTTIPQHAVRSTSDTVDPLHVIAPRPPSRLLFNPCHSPSTLNLPPLISSNTPLSHFPLPIFIFFPPSLFPPPPHTHIHIQ